MTRHLLLVTVGPVQEFIAQARRTRDLWYGSHLLSELSRKAAATLADDGAELIFPALRKGDGELLNGRSPLRDSGPGKGSPPTSIANKILAEVPHGRDPRRLAQGARRALADYWRDEIAREVKVRCAGIIASDAKLDDAWDEQIGSLIEFNSAWAPIEESAGGYRKARVAVEKAIAARKNLRDFEPWTRQRGGVPKSSLDGARETVLKDPRIEPRDKAAIRRYRIADAEQLDAVGLVKRAGGEPEQFVPVVNVALAPWIAFAEQQRPKLLEQLRADCRALGLAQVKRPDLHWTRAFPFDAGILLASRWRSTFDEQGLGAPERAEAWGRRHVGPPLAALTDPYPYVACLVADGDHMGAAIDIIADAEAHRTFSRNLAQFAADARSIVQEKHFGSLVYAGGDDVLAFLPLPTAVACAEALRQRFSDIMKSACASIERTSGFRLPTLSVGIGIGHVMEGMGDLLLLGRRAEKLAKGSDLPKGEGRNALAVILDKRSGGTRQWRAQWTAWGGDPVARLRADGDLLARSGRGDEQDARLSKRKVYEVARTLARLPQAGSVAVVRDQRHWARLLRMEVLRSLARVERGDTTTASERLGPDDVARRLGLRLAEEDDYAACHREVSSWIDRALIASVIADAEPGLHRNREVAA